MPTNQTSSTVNEDGTPSEMKECCREQIGIMAEHILDWGYVKQREANEYSAHYIRNSEEVRIIITEAIDGELADYSHVLSEESRVALADKLYTLISDRVGRSVAEQETVADQLK